MTDGPLSWPVVQYPDGSARIKIPGHGWKLYSEEELAEACVEVLNRGDQEDTAIQRLVLERLCGPERWRQVNAAVETGRDYMAELADLGIR